MSITGPKLIAKLSCS